GIEVAVASARHAELDVLWKNTAKDVSGAAGVVVRGDENHALDVALTHEAGELLCFLDSARCAVREAQDVFLRDAPLDEVVRHQLGNIGIRAQAAAAGDNHRSQALPENLRGA